MKHLLAAILFFFLPAFLWAAAPTFDVVSTHINNNASTVAGSHTVGGTCSNSYAVATVGWQHASLGSVSSVSYGATAMALLLAQDAPDTERRMEMWGVKAPPVGVQTVTATLDAAKNSLAMTVRTYCSVHQTTSTGTAVGSQDSSDPATVNVASASGELVVDGMICGGSCDPVKVGGGQTQRSNFSQDPTNFTQTTSDEVGAGTVTMSWTLSVGDYWAIVAVPLKPTEGAPSGVASQVIITE